jgi:hypothetical protein
MNAAFLSKKVLIEAIIIWKVKAIEVMLIPRQKGVEHGKPGKSDHQMVGA